jgi:hypothetical protein
MNKQSWRLLLFFPLLLTCSSLLRAQESITVTTYYPSPYGVYRELRSQRMAIGDDYINGSAYCWEGACTTAINANADLVVQGNVGIGTPSPEQMLHIRNQSSNAMLYCRTDSSTSAAGIYVRNDIGQPLAMEVFGSAYGGTWAGLTSNRMAALVATNPSNFIIGTNNGGNLVFGTALNGSTTSERMRITETGNVGIGTNAPKNKLDIEGAVAVGAAYSGTATGPGNGMIIEGNVGIGTINPARKLDVNGKIAVRGGPNYISAPATLIDHGTVTFTHNLGYIPWIIWTSSNENQIVSIRSVTTTQVTLAGWSPVVAQSTNVVIYAW